jgi:hypothetical protein
LVLVSGHCAGPGIAPGSSVIESPYEREAQLRMQASPLSANTIINAQQLISGKVSSCCASSMNYSSTV